MYTPSERVKQQIEKAFTYHPPKESQPERYVALRDKTRELAEFYATMAPESRELSMALTDLERASQAVNAAIARNE